MKKLLKLFAICLILMMSMISCEDLDDCFEDGTAEYCVDAPLGVAFIPNSDLVLPVIYGDDDASSVSVPEGSIEIPIYQSETQYWGTAIILDISKKMPKFTVDVDEYTTSLEPNSALVKHTEQVDTRDATPGGVETNDPFHVDSIRFVNITDVAENLPKARILNDGQILVDINVKDAPAFKLQNEFRALHGSQLFDRPIIKIKTDGSATMVVTPEWLDWVFSAGYGASPANSANIHVPNPKKFPIPRDSDSETKGRGPGDWFISE